MKLKLYVWEDVLQDYTPGVMFALAKSPTHARELLLQKCSFLPANELSLEPREVTTAEGFYVYGGS